MKKIKFDDVPIIKSDVAWTEDNEKIVVSVVNKGFFNRMLQLFAHKPKISYIHLDEIGSFVWKEINGNNSVYFISGKLKQKFDKKVYPLHTRLHTFLRILYKYHLISFR